jgi:hypothetical protein
LVRRMAKRAWIGSRLAAMGISGQANCREEGLDMSEFQNPSWCDACGSVNGERLLYPQGWLVAQIYFATDEDRLDANDQQALNTLYSTYILAPEMIGAADKTFHLVGRADHRGSPAHNLALGKRRALAVKEYFDQKFASFGSVTCEAMSLGERDAAKTRVPEVLAGDRRVDVFAPFRIEKPKKVYQSPNQVVRVYKGTRVVWSEFLPDAPETSIADKTDMPSSSRGSAAGSAVNFGQKRLDLALINAKIESELKRRQNEAMGYLIGHRTGGILAEALIFVRYDPSNAFGEPGKKPVKNYGPTARRLVNLDIGSRVYALPQHAVSVRDSERRRGRLAEERPIPNCEYVEYRYFWGRWTSK